MSRLDRIVSRSINSGARWLEKVGGKGQIIRYGRETVGTGGHWYRARLADLIERRRAKAKAAELAGRAA